jgi:hypothetical protein
VNGRPATFADELEAQTAAVEQLTVRAQGIAAMRAAKGARIGAENRERLASLAARLDGLAAAVRAAVAGEQEQADTAAELRALMDDFKRRNRCQRSQPDARAAGGEFSNALEIRQVRAMTPITSRLDARREMLMRHLDMLLEAQERGDGMDSAQLALLADEMRFLHDLLTTIWLMGVQERLRVVGVGG